MIGSTAIDDHLKKATLLSDSEAWFEAHTPQLKKDLLDLIRVMQLTLDGVDMNNDIIGVYSLLTDILTGGRKQYGTPYTLDDTGEFYRSMYVTVLQDSILIDADYQKMQDQSWWSIDILGLTDQNLEFYAEMVKENFIKYARRILDLN